MHDKFQWFLVSRVHSQKDEGFIFLKEFKFMNFFESKGGTPQ